MVEIKVGDVRWDRYGPFRVMAKAEGYLMVRRKGCAPHVMHEKEWRKLMIIDQRDSAKIVPFQA